MGLNIEIDANIWL